MTSSGQRSRIRSVYAQPKAERNTRTRAHTVASPAPWASQPVHATRTTAGVSVLARR